MNPPLQTRLSSNSVLSQRSLQLYDDVHFEPDQLVALFKSAIQVNLFQKNKAKFDRLISQIKSSASQFPSYLLRNISRVTANKLCQNRGSQEQQTELLDLLRKTIRPNDVIEILNLAMEAKDGTLTELCEDCIKDFAGVEFWEDINYEYTFLYETDEEIEPVFETDFACDVMQEFLALYILILNGIKDGRKEFISELRNSNPAIRIVYTIGKSCCYEEAKLMTIQYGELIDCLVFKECHESIQEEGKVEELIRNCSRLNQLTLDGLKLQQLNMDPSHLSNLRVLEFNQCPKLERIPSKLGNLLHLSLKNCPRMTHLPMFLKLRNLRIEKRQIWLNFCY
jgi:hypothetical protein